MKTKVRIGALVLALGLATMLAGCASQPTHTGQRVRSSQDFEIVETSTKRLLSPREMAYLRTKVTDYLDREGVTEYGDYYLKINLAAEEGLDEDEWVVVRYTKGPAVRYTVQSMTPTYYDPYYSSYSYNTFPFPGYGYTGLSFQYYDYPYYGYRPFPISRRPHPDRGHHGDRGGPGGRPDRDRDDDRGPSPGDGRPSGALKPSFKPTFVPANVNRSPENAPDPLLNAEERNRRLPNRVDVRSRPTQRTITPGLPRPGPTGAPDYSVNRPVPAERAGTPRPNFNQRPPQVRPDATATQRTAPRQTTPAVREGRGVTVPRQSPAAPFKPSAPQVRSTPAPAPVRTAPASRPEPAPVYRAPVERTESRQESNSPSFSGGRADSPDVGSREPRH